MRKFLLLLSCVTILLGPLAGEAHALFGSRKKKKSADADSGKSRKKGKTSQQARARRVVRLPRDLPLQHVWHMPIGKYVVRGGVHVYDDVILVRTSGHWLYMIRKFDGVVQWIVELRQEPDRGFDPIVTNVGVYVVINNEILFIDKDAGQIVWKLEPDFSMSTAPLIVEPNIYVPSWTGKFFSLTIRSKERIYVQGKSREDSLIDRKYWLSNNWHITTKGHITRPARMRDNILYFGSEDDYFYAITREGKERYRFQTQGAIKAPCTTKPGRVYVGSTDFNLYALNRLTGAKEWDFPTGRDILEAPYVDFKAGVVLAPSFRNGIFGIDERSGDELWHIEDALKVIAVGPERFYLGLRKNRIAAVEKKTGVVKWMSLLKYLRFYVPAPNDYTKKSDPMRAYFVNSNNVLICLKEREADVGPWTPGAGLRARGE